MGLELSLEVSLEVSSSLVIGPALETSQKAVSTKRACVRSNPEGNLLTSILSFWYAL